MENGGIDCPNKNVTERTCKLGKQMAHSHREFRLRNGRGKTCLWKKNVLVYFDN